MVDGTSEKTSLPRPTVSVIREDSASILAAYASPRFNVSGRVVDVPVRGSSKQPDRSVAFFAYVSAEGQPGTPSATLIPNLRPELNGEFQLSLPRGNWDLFPVINVRSESTTGPALLTSRARVVVDDRDVDDVNFSVAPAEIRGRVVIPGWSRSGSTPHLSMKIGLSPQEYYPEPFVRHLGMQSLGPQGEFHFRGVPGGRYAFQFFGLPSAFHIADIRVGARSISSDGKITAIPAVIERVEIILGPGAKRPIR